ncbi:hypothetical protein LINGRAHAP2_LOCUS14090 [Linum grandiflorum]
MEAGLVEHGDAEREEEYVLLDLDAVMDRINIRADMPYVLTGLDTLNPMLIVDGKWKLIGEYEETVGTCLVFSENGTCIVDPNQGSGKEVKPVGQLQKVLKFRLLLDDGAEDHHPSNEGNVSNPSRAEDQE